MKKTILTLTIATLLVAPSLHGENLSHPPINPALLYWQAASELSQLSNEQADELVDMATGRKAFDPAKAKHLLESSTTLRLIRKASDSTAACDWGLPIEDGPATIMPHLAKMRQMSSLAIVQAEALFADGKTKQGLDWLLVAHRMARHAGTSEFVISYMVQNIMEISAVRAGARHCLEWDTETRHEYAAALKGLPPLRSVQAAFHGERILIDWIERHVTAGGKADAELQAAFANMPGSKEGGAATLASETSETALTAWRELQARMEAALGKPWTEAQPELQALEEEASRSSNALVRASIPSTRKVAESGCLAATLQTMLSAALEYGPQLSEPLAATYHDSLEGEPLRLKKGDNGTLTLLAAHPHPADNEISLQIGK